MTRITDSNQSTRLLFQINRNRESINRYSDELATGVKVRDPSDSNLAATVARSEEGIKRIESHLDRVKDVQSLLEFQEATMNSAGELLIRAQEIATQAASETMDENARRLMADEVYALRDQFASLVNGRFQGKYVYGAADDDDPPYDIDLAFYTEPAVAARENSSYRHDGELGTDLTRSVQITDSLEMTVNSNGNLLFENGMQAFDRLGRALAGFETLPAHPAAPDGTGVAYVFPNDFQTQTAAIEEAIDLFQDTRVNDIVPEKTTLGSKLKRLENAEGLLEQTKQSLTDVLSRIRDADFAESATNLTQSQQSLEASLAVSGRLLNLSLLDFI